MIRGGSHQWGGCWKSSRVGNVSPFLSPRRRSLSAARGAQARTPGTRGPFCELGIASLKGPAPGAGGRQAEAGAPRGFSVATALGGDGITGSQWDRKGLKLYSVLVLQLFTTNVLICYLYNLKEQSFYSLSKSTLGKRSG